MCVVLKQAPERSGQEGWRGYCSGAQANCIMFAWRFSGPGRSHVGGFSRCPVDLELVICVCVYHALCAFLLRGTLRSASSWLNKSNAGCRSKQFNIYAKNFSKTAKRADDKVYVWQGGQLWRQLARKAPEPRLKSINGARVRPRPPLCSSAFKVTRALSWGVFSFLRPMLSRQSPCFARQWMEAKGRW